jgi:RsiW-degrading membrane proteinase PrsW (M82 family)
MVQLLILIAITLGPALAICLYIFTRDDFRNEPRAVLFFSFLFGGLTIIPAALIETWLMSYTEAQGSNLIIKAIEAFLIIGLTEEYVKFFVLRHYTSKKPSFDEPFDGIVYSVFISMGFAMFENILYVMQGGLSIALMRMFTAIPAHATFAVLMGHFYGLSKMKRYPDYYKYFGLAAATLFHGAYDYFLMISNDTLIVLGAFVSLIVGIRYAFRAIRIHKEIEKQQENHFF